MLKVSDLTRLLQSIPELQGEGHILEGNGYDGIMAILKSLRETSYPCVILESRSSGQFSIGQSGPLDTGTQSMWVMGQMGRNEDECALYRSMFNLCRKIIRAMLSQYPNVSLSPAQADASLTDWDPTRISYMQRYGGPTCRGYELMLNFREYTDFTVHEGSGSGSGSGSGTGN